MQRAELEEFLTLNLEGTLNDAAGEGCIELRLTTQVASGVPFSYFMARPRDGLYVCIGETYLTENV